jgi:hypothetical protein
MHHALAVNANNVAAAYTVIVYVTMTGCGFDPLYHHHHHSIKAAFHQGCAALCMHRLWL